jgi:tetratricopeptide (TPR) repeat protein
VHYLLRDPDANKNQFLAHFLKILDETEDSEEAARKAFGDLKKFGERIESYTRQPAFQYQRLKPQTNFSDKEIAVRQLSSAEVLAIQADFLLHTGHGKEAITMLKEAIQQQPTLAAAHSSVGYYDYQQHDNDAAEKEFNEALKFDPQDFRAYYFLAEITLRSSDYQQNNTQQIIKNLEKVVQINPSFAPAHAFLSAAYRQQKETKEKALVAAMRAAKLDPTRLYYIADVGEALIALGREQDALSIGKSLTKSARTPEEKDLAEKFNKRLR